MDLRKNCPPINFPVCNDKEQKYQLDWRIEEFHKWLNDDGFEPIGGICNRVMSIMWRAFSWEMKTLQEEVVAVAKFLLKNLPEDAENYKRLSDMLNSYTDQE